MTRETPWVLWLPFQLPGLNELLDARLRGSSPTSGGLFSTSKRKRYNEYSKLKKKRESEIALMARSAAPLEQGYFTYIIIEPSRRRDPSNLVAGAQKLVEDALQKAGKLNGDGWKQILGIRGYWFVGKRPGVLVVVTQDDVLSPREAEEQMKGVTNG